MEADVRSLFASHVAIPSGILCKTIAVQTTADIISRRFRSRTCASARIEEPPSSSNNSASSRTPQSDSSSPSAPPSAPPTRTCACCAEPLPPLPCASPLACECSPLMASNMRWTMASTTAMMSTPAKNDSVANAYATAGGYPLPKYSFDTEMTSTKETYTMTPAEKDMVQASSRRLREPVHSTKVAPIPVARPAPRLIAKACARREPPASADISFHKSSEPMRQPSAIVRGRCQAVYGSDARCA